MGKIKFKRELKVVGGSKVHIWEVNSTSRGNSQMERQWGKSGPGVSKEQKACQCVENSEQSGEEKATVREETEAQISRAVEALWGLCFSCEEATEETWVTWSDLCFNRISLDAMLIRDCRRIRTSPRRPIVDSKKWFTQKCASSSVRMQGRDRRIVATDQIRRSAWICVTVS